MGQQETPLPDVKPFKRGQVYLDLPDVDLAVEPRPAQSLPDTYRLWKLAVVRPRKELAAGSHGERCELVVLVLPGSVYEGATYLTEPPGDTAIPTVPPTLQGFRGSNPLKGIRVSDSYWRDATTFEAKKGQPNLWTVRLPDELTREVREKLKAESRK